MSKEKANGNDGAQAPQNEPKVLEVVDITSKTIAIRWDSFTGINTDEDPITYEFYLKKDDGEDKWHKVDSDDNIDTYTYTDLEPLTDYSFYVSCRQGGKTIYMFPEEYAGTTEADEEAPIAGSKELIISGVSQNSISIQWEKANDNETADDHIRYQVALKRHDSSNWDIQDAPTAGSHTFTDLDASTEYDFYVKAYDDAGNALLYNVVTAITADVEAPTVSSPELKVSKITADSFTIKWAKAKDNVTDSKKIRYEVYVKKAGEEDSKWVKVEDKENIVSFKVNELEPATNYELYVKAIDEAGNEFCFPVSKATTKDNQAPVVSSPDLTLSAIKEDGFTISWTKATDNVTPDEKIRYQVFLGIDGEWINKENSVNITSYTFTGLKPCKEYGFRVEASDEAENVLRYTDGKAKTIDKTAPIAASTTISVSNLATDSFSIRWEPASDNITPRERICYNIWLKAMDNAGPWRCVHNEQNITSYTLKGLKDGTRYSFYVEALDENGNTLHYFQPESNEPYEITTLIEDKTAPKAKSSLITVSNLSATSFTINWEPASDNVTPSERILYKVWLKVFEQRNWQCIHEEKGITSYSFTGLKEGTRYSYYVEAVDEKENKWPYHDPKTGNTFNTATKDVSAPTVSNSDYAISEPSGNAFTIKWQAAKDNVTDSKKILYKVFLKEHCKAWDYSKPFKELTGDTSYTFKDLKNGTEYDFFVEAYDENGNMTKYSEGHKAIADTVAPTATSKMITASGISSDSFTIHWQPASDNVTTADMIRYKIWLKTIGQDEWRCIDEMPGITSYTFTGLKEATHYCYFVEAFDQAGNKWRYSDPNTNASFGTTTIDTAPFVSDKTLRTTTQGTNITINWSPVQDTVTPANKIKYRVYRTEADSWLKPQIKEGLTSHTFTGLKSATSYSFRVEAEDQAGNVFHYNDVMTETDDTEVPNIHNGIVKAVKDKTSANSITIEWSKATDKVTKDSEIVYRVSRTESGIWGPMAELKGVSSHSFNGLKPATTYQFRVYAIDKAGNASVYPVISETTLDSSAPVVSSNVLKATPTANQVLLEWTLANDNVTSPNEIRYVVSQIISNRWQEVQTLLGKSRVVISGLTSGSQYSFRVVALDKAGNGFTYNTVSVTTKDNLAPVINNSIIKASVATTSVILEWTPATDNVTAGSKITYIVSKKLSGGTWERLTTLPGMNKYTVSGLAPGKQYFFKVDAIDEAGNEATYNTVSATIPDTEAPTINNKVINTAITHNSVTLSWAAASDNVSSHSGILYRVYRQAPGENAWSSIYEHKGITSYQVTGLKPVTQYRFFVRAIDESGCFTDYNIVSATTTIQTFLSKSGPVNCNGVYGNGAIGLEENLGSQFNRYYFELSFRFCPQATDKDSFSNNNVLTLDSSYRVLGIIMKDNYIYVTTNNQSNYFNTGISYSRNAWTSISLIYNNGSLTINGRSFYVGKLLLGGGNNVLSSRNYSNGCSFKGVLSNILVKSKPTDALPAILSKTGPMNCNGIYGNGEVALKENLGSRLNRNRFEITFDFYPTRSDKESAINDNIITLDSSYRALGLIMKNGYVFVTTNNGDKAFDTGIRFSLNTWSSIILVLDNGKLTINGKLIQLGTIQWSSSNNILSSLNNSNGHAFKGQFKNLVVKSK